MNIAKLKKYWREKKSMINNNELEEMMANTDFKYFEVLSDNREILGKFKDKIMDISSFHAVQKLINKVSVEEYTDNVLKKVNRYLYLNLFIVRTN